ncbi:MAG: leucyl aminopeptidase, partial [Planctomycetota bacterium JB042]
GVERGQVVGAAANLARELGDMPGNVLTPTVLAERSTRMARSAGLKSRVYRKKDLERLGMGGILAVNRGSHEPPVLIELTYQPKRFSKTVCLVGKGLTFDTGGISLKPSANMEEMKYDMCGGAAVIGAMDAVARLKPNVKVVGIVPSTDNMPGGAAQKPGDTLETAAGLTVEVINTDAEGRLILADGLHHATKQDPDFIVDLATLTGACVIALGHDAAGLYSNDDGLTKMLTQAGEEAGDLAWPMPLFREYQDDLKSTVADLKNLGPREGGAGTAAAFLSRFVGDHKWAHLDIAGTAWGARDRNYVGGKLASGAGVRLLVQWLESLG